eukprot:6974958-Alexandrium_andersonii.AAC.1
MCIRDRCEHRGMNTPAGHDGEAESWRCVVKTFSKVEAGRTWIARRRRVAADAEDERLCVVSFADAALCAV